MKLLLTFILSICFYGCTTIIWAQAPPEGTPPLEDQDLQTILQRLDQVITRMDSDIRTLKDKDRELEADIDNLEVDLEGFGKHNGKTDS